MNLWFFTLLTALIGLAVAFWFKLLTYLDNR